MGIAHALRFAFFLLPLSVSCALAQQEAFQVPAERARYDFGRLAGPWNFKGFPLASLDVKPVIWLSGAEMQFRLEYEDKWRRRVYSDSQWVAPPAALLERFLTRRILFRQKDPEARGCHLTFLLHELDQTFDTPNSSRVTLEVLATLSSSPQARTIAKRAFYIQKTAPTPDAVGSVAATRESVQLLSEGIDEWLSDLSNETPRIAVKCRSAKPIP